MQEGPDHQTGFSLGALVPSVIKTAARHVNGWWNAPPDYSREQALWDDWEENENDRSLDLLYVRTNDKRIEHYKALINKFELDPFREFRISPGLMDPESESEKWALFPNALHFSAARLSNDDCLLFWLQEKRVNPLTAPTNYFDVIRLFKESRTPRTLHAMMMSLDRSTPEQLAILYAIVKRREKATVSSPQELLNWGLEQGDEGTRHTRKWYYTRYVEQLPQQETSTSNPMLGSDTGDGEGNGVSPVPAAEIAPSRDSGSTSSTTTTSSSSRHSDDEKDDDSYDPSHSWEAKKSS